MCLCLYGARKTEGEKTRGGPVGSSYGRGKRPTPGIICYLLCIDIDDMNNVLFYDGYIDGFGEEGEETIGAEA